jgi:predicted acyl esterase
MVCALFTVVYVPKDTSKAYPFLMVRTPYGSGVHDGEESHYGVDFYPRSVGPSKEFENSGYIFVNQDVRGRYMSEGKWQEMTPHAKLTVPAKAMKARICMTPWNGC